MVAITKEESQVIRQRFPNAHIVRTMKQKSKRHHYYCEETKRVMNTLAELRSDTGAQEVGAVNGLSKKK